MTKVKKNSEQYQENVRKQQFLNANEIKVKNRRHMGALVGTIV